MITLVYGKPRAGKTTYAARLVYFNNLKLKISNKFPFLRRILSPYTRIYSNESTLSGTIYFPCSDVGKFPMPENSLFIFDEAGLEFNSLNYKQFPEYSRAEAALHGHRGHDYVLISQRLDIEISFRDRAHRILLIERSGAKSKITTIKFTIDVNNETHQLEEQYQKPETLFQRFIARLTHQSYKFRRSRYYKYFDSFVDSYPYPVKTTPEKYLKDPLHSSAAERSF